MPHRDVWTIRSIFAVCFFAITHDVCAQKISVTQESVMQELLDSAELYRLIAPERTLDFATTILNGIPAEGNEHIYVRALLHAANSEKMRSHKLEALSYCTQAIALTRDIEDAEYQIRAYFMKATVFGQYDDRDSLLIYYQKVIELHQTGMDPYYVSSAYANVGEVYNSIGNTEKAEEYLLKAYKLSSDDEFAKLFALSQVIMFYNSDNNPKYLPYLDTLAMSDFYKKSSHTSFLAHFDTFLNLGDATDADREKKLREVYAYALEHSALTNQIGFGMKLYGHLAKEHKYAEARDLLLELRNTAIQEQNGIHIAGVTRALYENSKDRGNMADALMYLERHSQLRDSLLSDENRNTISELNIRFETAQKDSEIAQQGIRLEQERRNRNFFIALALSLTALATLIFFYFRNRARTARRISEQEKVIHSQEKVRLLREKEVAELTASLETQERERNRIARDLHDGLGSLMSGISAQIETLKAQPAVEAAGSPYLGQLRDMVKEATSELRRTSYELMPASLLRLGLEPAVRDLCINLLVKNGIDPALEINADLTRLTHEQQLTIYRIIQELLNNIVKHAGAQNVLVQFNRYEDEISLVVEDDGVGFNVADKKMHGGLGLGSLHSRVNLLKGFLDFASIPGEGTTVTVNFIMAERQND